MDLENGFQLSALFPIYMILLLLLDDPHVLVTGMLVSP